MSELKDFANIEQIKNRLATMIKASTDVKLKGESLDEVAPRLAQVVTNFKDMAEKEGGSAAINYLIDVAGFYMVLTEELCKLCDELAERSK